MSLSLSLCILGRFSRVQLFASLWTVAHQSPLSMVFSKQEYWSRLHALLQGIFPTQGSNPCFLSLLHWQAGSLSLLPPVNPIFVTRDHLWLTIDTWSSLDWRNEWQPKPVFLSGESHGQKSLGDYSPWGSNESRTRLSAWYTHTHTHTITEWIHLLIHVLK